MIPPWFGTSNLKTFEGHGRGHFSFEAKPGRDPSIHCLTCVTQHGYFGRAQTYSILRISARRSMRQIRVIATV